MGTFLQYKQFLLFHELDCWAFKPEYIICAYMCQIESRKLLFLILENLLLAEESIKQIKNSTITT